MDKAITITRAIASDVQFELGEGAGSDAVHTTPVYAYAVCRLQTDKNLEGVGLAFTLGKGNDLVCRAISYLSKHVEGKEIEELMANFGVYYRAIVDDPNFRWLGPHKGVVHLALASITNACFDLWAKSRDVPLWKLLIDLPAESIVDTLDLSYLEDVIEREEAVQILNKAKATQGKREYILKQGYKGYDTSVGWFNYTDQKVRDNIKKAMDLGFTAMKLKVGSKDAARDVRRAQLVRETAGEKATIMLDANQQWNLPQALSMCKRLKDIDPYWIEEPTHPDDIYAHTLLARELSSVKLAMGEHIPNKILFKNYLQAGCMSFNQVDAVRVGGVSEFMAISLLSKKFGVPIVPHVGDMGQIHQHLVLFNHIAVGHEALFLEYIPHLRNYFKHPATVANGYYSIPQEPGMGTDLKSY
ncbi:MAG: enolase C-terminal domain-like protein [Flavobacteriaceae bacterium]